MDFLPLHSKDSSCLDPGVQEPSGSFVGRLDASSMHVVIPCSYESFRLHRVGAYGSRLGEHNDYICSACFGKRPVRNGKRGERQTKVKLEELEVEDPVRKWKNLTFGDRGLRLSPEEALYLVAELKVLTVDGHGLNDLWKHYVSRFGRKFVGRCAVYRHLRRQGWVPKPGISLGCDYAVYRCGPDYYHSSAGVTIRESGKSIKSEDFQTLVRSLANMRKAFVLMVITVPEAIDSPNCLDDAVISDLGTNGRWTMPNPETLMFEDDEDSENPKIN